MKKSSRAAFVLICVWLAAASASAATRLGESCDLSVLGVRDDSGFHRFDDALREAVASRDAHALGALVRYPVRLNDGNAGHVEIGDAAALEHRFADALWPTLRRAVLGRQPDELFCNADGVMYGDGAVWADPDRDGRRFRIAAFNLAAHVPAPAESASTAAGRSAGTDGVLLTCDTAKFHIVIAAAADHRRRCRSWNRPRLPPDEPALDLAGDENREGTGVCAHRIWRFRNGNTRYIVAEPGCNAGDVPAGAKARLEVESAGRTLLQSWCR